MSRFFSFFSEDYRDDEGMAETKSFRIKYDGEALSDHTIDINDLAPALLSLADLMQEANRIANNDTSKISLKVKATETGCFQISIQLIQDILHDSVGVLAGEKVTALTNLITLIWGGSVGVGLASAGVIYLIKRVRNGKPLKAIGKGEDEVEIQTESGSITITKLQWEMFQSPRIRKALYGIVKPLEKPGVEKVDFIDENENIATIKKSEVQLFIPPEERVEPLSEIPPRETWVNVVHSWFRGDNKWKFKEGENEWSAEIKDNKFIEQLLKGETSINGSSLLKVRVKQTQYREGNTVHSDYEILEVIENVKGYTQIPLT
jgi:hypothetical protein